ncbi:MAG: hypothetical protein AAGI03_14250 [Pseudomonadota bacterium]
MTATNPLQLHLFDANPDPASIPPECRRRLLTLTGALLWEAAHNETAKGETLPVQETRDE